jgi:hypothetical protein
VGGIFGGDEGWSVCVGMCIDWRRRSRAVCMYREEIGGEGGRSRQFLETACVCWCFGGCFVFDVPFPPAVDLQCREESNASKESKVKMVIIWCDDCVANATPFFLAFVSRRSFLSLSVSSLFCAFKNPPLSVLFH